MACAPHPSFTGALPTELDSKKSGMLIALGVYVPSGTVGGGGAGAGSGFGGGGGGGAGVSVAEMRRGFPAGTLTSFSSEMNVS